MFRFWAESPFPHIIRDGNARPRVFSCFHYLIGTKVDSDKLCKQSWVNRSQIKRGGKLVSLLTGAGWG